MSTFSDPGVQSRLVKEFIPFAGNTHELQVGKSAARDWFMGAIKETNPGAHQGATAQGFYILAGDGASFGVINTRNIEEVFKFMDRGLEGFAKHPPAEEAATAPAATEPWTKVAPAGTCVVRVIARIRPVPEGARPNNFNIGRDHMWLFPEEVAEIAALPQGTCDLPERISLKLVRFHLLDFVRGEPDRWFMKDLHGYAFSVRRRGDSFALLGRFKMRTPDERRGLEGSIEGRFEYDPATKQIVRFRAFAQGEAWGDHRNTSGAPEGKFPLLLAFVQVDDAVSRAVPPQQSFFWDEYLNPLKDDMGF